jgi:hypothetical protein
MQRAGETGLEVVEGGEYRLQGHAYHHTLFCLQQLLTTPPPNLTLSPRIQIKVCALKGLSHELDRSRLRFPILFEDASIAPGLLLDNSKYHLAHRLPNQILRSVQELRRLSLLDGNGK